MMRAQTPSKPNLDVRPLRTGFKSGVLGASVLALAIAGPITAQNSPGSFSLPTPTPTPTPAPQGPLDERAGVPIAPRIIPDRSPAPTPQPSPTPTPARTAAPATAPTSAPPSNAPSVPRSPSTASASTATGSSTPAPTGPATNTPRVDIPLPSTPLPQGRTTGSDVGPGFSTDLIPGDGEGTIGPDDWYNVTPDGEAGVEAPVAAPESSGSTSSYVPGEMAALRQMAMRNQIYIGIGIMVLLGAILAFLFWRRRRSEAMPMEMEGPSLAMGVRKVITEGEPEAIPVKDAPKAPAKEKPAPKPTLEPKPTVAAARAAPPHTSQQPARLDISLDVTAASRSVMMFTIHFRIDISNRSNRAVRDLNIAAQMAFAQRGASNGAPIASGQPVGTLERIGPQQSRSIAGSLTLPLAELKTIHQGSKPLFIPLIHVTSEGPDQPIENLSFVVGSPSASSTGRVHPLTLDGPPGGIPGLRAQLIKAPAGENSHTEKPAQTA